MSNFFEELEAQLHNAARAQVRRQGQPRGGLGRWLRSTAAVVPILASAAVTIAIALVAVLLIAHGHSTPGDASTGPPAALTRRELRHIQRYLTIAGRAARPTSACHRHSAPPIPATTQAAPSAVLLRTVGVLRRSETRQDRLPPRLNVSDEARSIYVRYVRRARVVGGVSYYVLPVSSIDFRDEIGLSRLAACDRALRAALKRELPHIPPRLRAPALAEEATVIARGRQQVQAGVCLAYFAEQGQGVSCGDTVGQLKQWGFISAVGLAGIVPDGVASVTLYYPPNDGQPARTATSNVIGNVFLNSASAHEVGPLRPGMTWRSAAGKIIKTIPPERRSNLAPSASGDCSGTPANNLC